MPATSRLGKQIEEIVTTLNSAGAPFALVGGLALAPHNVIRATRDVGLLTDASMAESIHQALLDLGYTCLHRSVDAGNYQRQDGRVDLTCRSPTYRGTIASNQRQPRAHRQRRNRPSRTGSTRRQFAG